MSCCGKAEKEDGRPKTVADLDDDLSDVRVLNPVADSSPEDIDEMIDACMDGEILTVTRLLKQGVHVDSQDPDTGGTALIVAVLNGQKEITEMLIKAGPHSCCTLATALCHLQLYAVCSGADLEAKDPEFGMTPYLWG